ncbi:MAG: DNA adenine methylase [Negativicutes bacterium]
MPVKYSDMSPLRYPGSKAALVDYVVDVIAHNHLTVNHFVEPYAGSSIVSLQLLKNNCIGSATILEKDILVYAFWESVFSHTNEILTRLDTLPITIDTWKAFLPYRQAQTLNEYPIVDMGLAGLFYNRTNFSGILKANPLGGINQSSTYKIDCRFNRQKIMTLIADIAAYRNQVTVLYGDAMDFLIHGYELVLHNNHFLYIDPPYYEKGRSLYRHWYTHEEHMKLARFLTHCNTPWLASYDNHEAIRMAYHQNNLGERYFDYTISKYRKTPELLISNQEIPPDAEHLQLEDLA